MNYFTKEYWDVSARHPYKHIRNKKFPFISMTARGYRSGVWSIDLNFWNSKAKPLSKDFRYKKLSKDKYEEILYSFLKSSDGKNSIFNYLFEGGW